VSECGYGVSECISMFHDGRFTMKSDVWVCMSVCVRMILAYECLCVHVCMSACVYVHVRVTIPAGQ
jgi:hypothetical protein